MLVLLVAGYYAGTKTEVIMKMWSMTQEDLEESADIVKTAVLKALVRDELIDEEEAERWAESHTILHRKKSFFRTLTDKWKKDETDINTYCYIVVWKC